MNLRDLPEFFGLSTANQEFFVFLSSHGIEERLAFDSETRNPVALIELPESRVALEFVGPVAFAEKFGRVREDGDMIFSTIFVYLIPEDDYAANRGTWPPPFPASITTDAYLPAFGKPDCICDESDDFG